MIPPSSSSSSFLSSSTALPPQDEDGAVDMPFPPPLALDRKHSIIPSGIRPVLQKTRIEVSPSFYLSLTLSCCHTVFVINLAKVEHSYIPNTKEVTPIIMRTIIQVVFANKLLCSFTASVTFHSFPPPLPCCSLHSSACISHLLLLLPFPSSSSFSSSSSSFSSSSSYSSPSSSFSYSGAVLGSEGHETL